MKIARKKLPEALRMSRIKPIFSPKKTLIAKTKNRCKFEIALTENKAVVQDF